MQLTLTDQEQQLLVAILQTRLGELREAVYHADDHHFKDQLKQQETLLESLLEKVGGQST